MDHLRAYIAINCVGCETKRNGSLAECHMAEMLVVAETREG
jgi:hypothetical protein